MPYHHQEILPHIGKLAYYAYYVPTIPSYYRLTEEPNTSKEDDKVLETGEQ